MRRGTATMQTLTAVAVLMSLATVFLIGDTHAQGADPKTQAIEAQMLQEQQAAENAKRDAAAEAIISANEAASERSFDPAFRARAKSNLMSQPLSTLSSQSGLSGVGPLAIGDTAADLVFTPVTPCRIVDTRAAGGLMA